MRAIWGLAAAALLAGCGGRAPHREGESAALTGGLSGFDQGYAYRVPRDRLKGVLQSNADACVRLGPERCRVVALRDRDSGGRREGLLALRIAPEIARAFAEAVTGNVAGADGVIVESAVAGTDDTADARSAALVAGLNDALAAAQQDKDAARALRIRAALATIAEIAAQPGGTRATAPILFRYEASDALVGPGADLSLRSLGRTLARSAAALVQLLVALAPWLLVLAVAALALRWIRRPRAAAHEADPPAGKSAEPPPRPRDNPIKRWFAPAGD